MASDQWSVVSFMKVALIAFAIVNLCRSSVAQQQRNWEVDQLCGRVDQLQEIPDRKSPNTFSDHRRGLPDLTIELFERRDGQSCCDHLVALETTKTSKDGTFKFQTKNSGDFWLTADWNSKQYKVAVVNRQKKKSSAMCSRQGIDLDESGNANWWVTITFD